MAIGGSNSDNWVVVAEAAGQLAPRFMTCERVLNDPKSSRLSEHRSDHCFGKVAAVVSS